MVVLSHALRGCVTVGAEVVIAPMVLLPSLPYGEVLNWRGHV